MREIWCYRELIYFLTWRDIVEVLFLPLFVLLMLTTTLGVGFWLSALNVEYRDVMYVVPFLNQFWLFLTPVVYPSSIVPEQWRFLYGLNPMAGVVEGFRWSLLGAGAGPSPMLAASALVAVALFVSGIIWFRRRERTFVDALGSGGSAYSVYDSHYSKMMGNCAATFGVPRSDRT